MSAAKLVRRSLLAAAALGAVCLAGLLGARCLVSGATRAAQRHVTRLAAEHGIEISRTSWRSVRFVLPATIRWEGFALSGRFAGGDSPLPAGAFTLDADSATATLESFADRRVSISLDGLLFASRGAPRPAAASGAPRISALAGRRLEVRAAIDVLSPRTAAAQLRAISDALGELVRTGECALPVTFDGTATFEFRGPATAGVRVRREGAASVLSMDENDLLALSPRLGLTLPLTRQEATLLSRHPLRVPRLLAIREEARGLAEKERQRDSAFPEDAGRHLLWSHLLTTTYGERFAAEVTDAHEQGITDNTDAERLMDLSNNALGRWYAKLGVPAAALFERARSDSRVIRNPREIGSKLPFSDR